MEPLNLNLFKSKSFSPKAHINLTPYRNLDSKLNSKRSVVLNADIDNINKLVTFFARKGYTRPQIIGLISNIIDESGADPNAKQKGGGGIGLLQYTNKARKDPFLKFSPKDKYEPDYVTGDDSDSELYRQAEYIHKEMQGDRDTLPGLQQTHWLGDDRKSEREYFNSIGLSPERSAEIITHRFVRPGNIKKETKINSQRRMKLASFLNGVMPMNKDNPMFFKKGSLIFNKSQLVKNAEALNSKKDLRKKIVKSNTKDSDVKRKIFKKQLGGLLEDEFISYKNIPTPEIDLSSINMNTYSFDPYSYISGESPFKEKTPEQPAIEEELPTLEAVKPTEQSIQEVEPTPVVVDSSNFDPNYGLMKEFVDIAREENLPFRITSGYRPNARTSNGSASWHSKGLALDIVPVGVSWEEFKMRLSQSPKSLKWLRNNKM